MDIDEIRNKNPIKNVFERYGLKINRAGFCSCPFHADKTPSCRIYPQTNSWYCFGCGRSGDVIDIVMHFDGLSFKDACKALGGEENGSTDKLAWAARNRAKWARERAQKAKEDELHTLSYKINAARAKIRAYEPLSDPWTDAQNELQRLIVRWERLTDDRAN